MSMLYLILDTSCAQPYLILATKQKCISKTCFKKSSLLSKSLIPKLLSILKKNKVSIENISFIAISIGPGSFTGIRVGASIAKALSYIKKIPIITFFSLMSYIPKKDGSFISLLDAKRDNFFAVLGEKKNFNITYKNKPELLSKQDLNKYLTKDTLIISPDNIKEKFNLPFRKSLINIPHLCSIVVEKFQKKEYSLDCKVDLLYLKNPNVY
jgi:tRNA threonylcarbamoyladenosine biosynthesis protein TsaB